jgi:hypothetical protein
MCVEKLSKALNIHPNKKILLLAQLLPTVIRPYFQNQTSKTHLREIEIHFKRRMG